MPMIKGLTIRLFIKVFFVLWQILESSNLIHLTLTSYFLSDSLTVCIKVTSTWSRQFKFRTLDLCLSYLLKTSLVLLSSRVCLLIRVASGRIHSYFWLINALILYTFEFPWFFWLSHLQKSFAFARSLWVDYQNSLFSSLGWIHLNCCRLVLDFFLIFVLSCWNLLVWYFCTSLWFFSLNLFEYLI